MLKSEEAKISSIKDDVLFDRVNSNDWQYNYQRAVIRNLVSYICSQLENGGFEFQSADNKYYQYILDADDSVDCLADLIRTQIVEDSDPLDFPTNDDDAAEFLRYNDELAAEAAGEDREELSAVEIDRKIREYLLDEGDCLDKALAICKENISCALDDEVKRRGLKTEFDDAGIRQASEETQALSHLSGWHVQVNFNIETGEVWGSLKTQDNRSIFNDSAIHSFFAVTPLSPAKIKAIIKERVSDIR